MAELFLLVVTLALLLLNRLLYGAVSDLIRIDRALVAQYRRYKYAAWDYYGAAYRESNRAKAFYAGAEAAIRFIRETAGDDPLNG